MTPWTQENSHFVFILSIYFLLYLSLFYSIRHNLKLGMVFLFSLWMEQIDWFRVYAFICYRSTLFTFNLYLFPLHLICWVVCLLFLLFICAVSVVVWMFFWFDFYFLRKLMSNCCNIFQLYCLYTVESKTLRLFVHTWPKTDKY